MTPLPKHKKYNHLLLNLQKILLHAQEIDEAAGDICERLMAEKEIKGLRLWQQILQEGHLPARTLMFESGNLQGGSPSSTNKKSWHPILSTRTEMIPQWVETKSSQGKLFQIWVLPIESKQTGYRWILDAAFSKVPEKNGDLIAALEYLSGDILFQFEKFVQLRNTRQREEILGLFFAVAPALIVTLSHDERITMFEGNAVRDQKSFYADLLGEKASRARRKHPELSPILSNLILRQEETIDLTLGDRIIRTWFYRRKLTIQNEIDMVALGLDITDQYQTLHQNKELAGHLQQLAHELLADESRSRRKLAQQVHDQIGHQLAMLLVKMDLVCAKSAAPVKDALLEFRTPIQEALNESRSLSHEISPPILYKLGLIPAIEWFAEKTGKDSGLAIEVHGDETQDVDDENKALCYQIITELVVNAVKYAEANRMDIHVSCEDTKFYFSVKDDGKGMPSAGENMTPVSSESGGFGLFSIQQRLAYLGGNMVVKSGKNKGSFFEITIPITAPMETSDESK